MTSDRMTRYEVTFRARGPWQAGTRVEASLTLPADIGDRPDLTTGEDRKKAAIECVRPLWAAVFLPALEEAADGQLRVTVWTWPVNGYE